VANEITKVEIKLLDDDHYRVYVPKRFAEEYGGGESTICVSGALRNVHTALDVAKSAVTLTRAYRQAFEAENRS